ncbi:YjbQ family protein [Patescibacteria group bacterium]|nr:YjbQ family protein [Patescibacteria group bacterium]
MIIYQSEFILSTKGFSDVINITDQIEKALNKAKIKQGICLVFVQGSTAGITAIEYEPNLIKDWQEFIEKLIPQNKKYHHDATWGDDNGFSHIRASLIGPSISLSIDNNKLVLGTWQQIVVCDFDNRARQRKITIKIIGE